MDNDNSFTIKLQAVLDKIKSLANIKADIKAIESKLPKIKIKGTLDKAVTNKELKAKLKDVKPKVKVEADTTQAEKKIKKIGKQKTEAVIKAKADNSQVVSEIKEAQKETKTLWERFTSGITGINLIQMGIQKIVQSIHQAIVNIKELDAIKTNIQMVSGTSDSDVNAMMGSYNAMAKDLSSTTKDVAEAANEFLRMGESVEATNELIKSAQVLSKIGMIENSDAASYLISSLKGYQVAAKDSIDIVSKLTAVDLEAAVSAGGLSEALSKCANIANNSGISMDRLIGYTATVGEITQKSMSEVGNSFQSLLSRMNNIKIGRFIDDETGESLSDTEAVLNKLGIQLRDTENTYRDFDDVLDDVGSRWKDFTKVEQNAISVAIAGTRQRENFEALMNNWTNALKYSETAANSAGSALERYGVYQDSIEAKTNELTAAMESLSTNTISEELYSGIIVATTNVVEFIDKANLLKGTLAGLVTMGVSKTIVSLGAGFITAAKSTAQLTTAMALFNKERSEQNLLDIGAACKGLSDRQLRLVLSTKGLEHEDRKLILAGMGLKEQEQEQMLATIGFAAAEDKATFSTFSLKGAWNSLTVAMATNPIGVIVTAVSIATMVFSGFNQAMEESRQKARDLGEELKSTKSDIDSYKSKIEDLYKTINDSNSSISDVTEARKNLMTIQDELIEKYGAEKKTIDIITDAINGQADAFDRLAEKQWQETKNQFNDTGFWEGIGNWLDGYDSNIDRMVDKMEHAREILSFSANDLDSGNYGDLVHQMEKLGWRWQDTLGGFVKEGNLKGIYSDILEIQNIVKDMDTPDGFLKDLTHDANQAKETIEDYGEMWDTYVLRDVILENEELAQSWNDVNEAYSDYRKAFESGDKEAQNSAIEGFSQSLNNVLDNSDVADSVKEYFRGMYPALTNEVEKWEFRYKILPDLDIHALKGKTQADILEMLQTDGSQYGEDTFNSLLRMASNYGIVIGDDSEKIKQLLDLLVEWEVLQGNIVDMDIPERAASFSDIFSLKGTDDTITNLGKISESIDTIQNAYKTLYDAIEEYNEEGAFSVDTLQSVIALGDNWLDYLVDEDGALKLDKESLEQLTQARLNDMRVQAINNVIDNVSKIESDADANEYLKTTNYALAESYEEVAEKAMESARAKMQDAVAAGTLSQANMDAAMNKATADISKINKLFANTSISTKSITGKSGSSSSSSTSSAKSEFSETIDFFKQRVEVLDDALSHLDSTMDNVAGSFGKNNLVDAELGITEEKFNNYTDALSMYTQKANEAFSKIPADIASKVKDGAVALTDFIGDGNKDVVEAIKDYESWAGEISTCKDELAKLKKEIRQLELEKFNNIMDDFKNQFDLRGDSKNLISKQIDLLKEAGELIGESFFTAQIDQSKKQLELLENEKAQLVNQMSSAISSGRIQSGTDEWLEMTNALITVDGSILDCKKSLEELDNSILSLHTDIFDRIQEQFSNLDSEISNIIDLFDEFEVSDDKGIWSKEAIAQLGLLSQQYELAQYRVQQYNDEIDELNAQYLQGKYSATEYADKLAELNSEQWNAVKASESALSSIMDLNEARVENAVKGIEKEIDAYKELISQEQESLKQQREIHDYQKSISEKTKNLENIDRQIAAVQNDTSASGIAQLKKLQAERQKVVEDLEEAEYEHSIEVQEDALNAQLENYTDERNKEIETLQNSLNDKEAIIANSFETVKANASLVGQEIAAIATEHGITVSNTLISSWQSGENAIASYGEVLSQNTSVFIGNIMGVENEVWNLQAQANTTANSLAWMLSTKADNLVNELNTSYYAEANLANMTNALQQSLVNTLERGYDVSSIVNSLNSVTSAANSAKAAIDSLNNSNNTTVDTSDAQGLLTNDIGKNVGKNLNDLKQQSQQYQLIDKTTGKIWKDNLSYAEALEYKKDHVTDINTTLVKKYASGTRNAEDGLRIVNEEGSELVLPKLSSGDYAIGNAGDQILTKAETDNIFEWAKYDPKDFTPVSMGELVESLRERSGNGRSLAEPMDFSALTKPSPHVIQEMFKNVGIPGSVVDNSVNNNSVNNYYDSMFAFNGDVIDADRAIKQMEKVAIKIADQRIDKSWREATNELRYMGPAAVMHHR